TGREITFPRKTHLFQYPLRHFCGQDPILLRGLHELIEFSVLDNRLGLDKLLPHLIQSGVIEVLACEGCDVNLSKARIMTVDPMLFHQLHCDPHSLKWPELPWIFALHNVGRTISR